MSNEDSWFLDFDTTIRPLSPSVDNNIGFGNTQNQPEINSNSQDVINRSSFKTKQDDPLNKLIEENKILTERVDGLSNIIHNLEIKISKIDQYSRRENLVISGVPNRVSQIDLEKSVLDILHIIGMTEVNSYDIVGCHRLGKKNGDFPMKTIVRFMNRSIAERAHELSYRLFMCTNIGLRNVRFHEHLCHTNQYIFKECVKLQKLNLIHDFFTWNGYLNVVIHDGDKSKKINHFQELKKMIPHYYIN